MHLKGFRPGKAPVSFLKKTYGKSLMGEIVNETINETSEQVLKEKEIKPATTPRVDFVNSLDSVIDGQGRPFIHHEGRSDARFHGRQSQ